MSFCRRNFLRLSLAETFDCLEEQGSLKHWCFCRAKLSTEVPDSRFHLYLGWVTKACTSAGFPHPPPLPHPYNWSGQLDQQFYNINYSLYCIVSRTLRAEICVSLPSDALIRHFFLKETKLCLKVNVRRHTTKFSKK